MPESLSAKVYSCRAETTHDVVQFFTNVVVKDPTITIKLQLFQYGIPDVKVELESNLALEDIRNTLRAQDDAHVMTQSLRQMSLADNIAKHDLERDENVQTN